MKVLFFGTPEIAVPFLAWLVKNQRVVGVVCQPDKPVGRGYDIVASPVKEFALKNNLPVFQPAGPWTSETIDQLKKTNADIGVAVAYGRIMPEAIFMAPKLGTLNIHFSLLPKYRGAAPVQRSLMHGEKETGVSAFWLKKEMDSGPLFHQRSLKIDSADNTTTLKEKLVPLGIEVLGDVFKDVAQNKIIRTPQSAGATFAPLIKKEDGHIDWRWPAEKIVNLIRGVNEWPGAVTSFSLIGEKPKQLKIFKAVAKAGSAKKTPGTICEADKTGFSVQTGDDLILIQDVQPEGKKKMPAWDFWQGAHLKVGDKLG